MSAHHKPLITALNDHFDMDVDPNSVEQKRGYYDVLMSLRTTEGRRYFLKLYAKESASCVMALSGVLDLLGERGFPVAKPVKLPPGRGVFIFDSMPGMLQDYIEGPQAADRTMTPDLAFELGKTLGWLHQITSRDKALIDYTHKPAPAWQPEGFPLVRAHFQEVAHELGPNIQRTVDDITADWQAQQAALASCERGFIHCDFNGSNVLLDPDSKDKPRVKGVIDFSDSSVSWYAADIGHALKYLFARDEKDWPLVSDFMRGYQSQRPLSEAELAVIPLFVRQRALTSFVENFCDNQEFHPGARDVLIALSAPAARGDFAQLILAHS